MNHDLININKGFGNLTIFNNFSISFKADTINCILGPSGCGKTTLLNIINGIVPPDSGNRDSFRSLRLSNVFQEPRLLPWQTVWENIEFVLKDHMSGKDLKNRLEEVLRLVQLTKFRNYYPSELSGGMKQRVALARAFSYKSDVILMDEPFKALDYKLKYNLIDEFLELWNGDKRTVIFVTHDVDEALHIGGYIFLLSPPVVKITNEFPVPDDEGMKESLRKILLEHING